MAEADTHPTAGRRRREKGPPSVLTLPRLDRVSDTEGEHSDDSAGEKEAKRQRSEPTTPVSTSGRLPYDYDALMGITKVGTKEAEGFDEDLDTAEYHDAAEEPTRRDESDNTVEPQRLSDFQGGYGSSSLKECIELLNTTSRIAPAPLDSGIGQKSTEPPQTLRPPEGQPFPRVLRALQTRRSPHTPHPHLRLSSTGVDQNALELVFRGTGLGKPLHFLEAKEKRALRCWKARCFNTLG